LAKHGKSADELAKGIGRSRAVVFRYLNGETAMTLGTLEAIANYLQLADWRELIPTTKFIRSLTK
jgi:transcriptional regulator with XRE-family HTH domain